MKTLKTLALIGASALAAGAVATTEAQAQPWRDYERPAYAEARVTPAYIDHLNARLTTEARAGAMTWNAAYHLGQELRSVRNIAWRAQQGRASPWELHRLNDTVARVEAQSRSYAYDDRHRGDRRYGDYNRYERYDRR